MPTRATNTPPTEPEPEPEPAPVPPEPTPAPPSSHDTAGQFPADEVAATFRGS